MRTFRVSLLVALAALAVAACGSSKKSTSTSTSTANSSTTSSTSKTGPGAGKPPIVLGDKNFEEEFVLGDLYQQALQAKGFTVTLKPNIGTSEITWKALTSGQIQMYPEYTGTLLSAIAGQTALPTNGVRFTRDRLLVSGLDARAFGSAKIAAIGDVTATAVRDELCLRVDLSPPRSVAESLTGEFATRQEGLLGLEKVYGLNPTFKPIAIGLTYKALDSGQVEVTDVFTTDPQLTTGKYVVLTDPKKIFGFQNVAPVVKQSLVKTEGPAFAQTINSVSALLTIPALQKMNAAVALDKQSPAAVAHAFLVANHLA